MRPELAAAVAASDWPTTPEVAARCEGLDLLTVNAELQTAVLTNEAVSIPGTVYRWQLTDHGRESLPKPKPKPKRAAKKRRG